MGQTEKAEPVRAKKQPQSPRASPAKAQRKSKQELVEQMIEKLEQKLTSKDVKPSVGDLIRLLQLEKELEEEQPREIRVSWVEARKEEHASDG